MFLQLLPRSSTGERMNPYTSMWTGVTPGDGPQDFHLVLLDNGRTAVLADAQRARRAELHPLQRLPQRLPGLRAGRRARLRLGLPRPDRGDPVPAADRHRGQRLAAVRVLAVRRLLRRLPGQDRHPEHPGPPAGRAHRDLRRRAPGAQRGGDGDGGGGLGDAQPDPVDAGPAQWPAGAGARPAPRASSARCRCPWRRSGPTTRDLSPPAAADLPRLVGRRARVAAPEPDGPGATGRRAR